MIKYDHIGKSYNSTRSADPHLLDQVKILLGTPDGKQIVEIGCGTGNYTIALKQDGYQIMGVDPSGYMLDMARRNSQAINWLQGSAESIPLETGVVDCVLAFLTVHHWENRQQGFKEIFRILAPGGKLVLFTSTSEQMENYWLNHYFPRMMADSIKQMPSMIELKALLNGANLEMVQTIPYHVENDLKDKFLYAGKHDPEFYLEEPNRQGISSFSDLAYDEEVRKGLETLKTDIETHQIQNIIKTFKGNDGDYLFIEVVKS